MYSVQKIYSIHLFCFTSKQREDCFIKAQWDKKAYTKFTKITLYMLNKYFTLSTLT